MSPRSESSSSEWWQPQVGGYSSTAMFLPGHVNMEVSANCTNLVLLDPGEFPHFRATQPQGFSSSTAITFNNSCPFHSVLAHQMDNTISRRRDSFTSIFLPSAEELLVSMPHTLKHMELDLIRTGVLAEPTENDTFPLQDLIPLVHFRQLRTLTIVGMLDSYQTQIWEAAWLCPHLEVLTLEMCLEPSIRKTRSREWPTIQGDWKMKSLGEIKRHY